MKALFPDLAGKRVIITAGATGIGRAMAKGFLDSGAHVHICDVAEDRLRSFASAESNLSFSVADVASPADVEKLFAEATRRLGGLDILINNAGIAGPTGKIESIAIDDWMRTIDVDLNAQFFCARLAIPLLKRADGGSIVNMSSSAGLMGYPMRSPYAVAKWGVIGLTKTMAMELGQFGIRVNAICPGSVEGDRMDRVVEAEASARGVSAQVVRAEYVKYTSMKCFVKAADVVALVMFICSDAGSRISGQALSVDGHTETLGSY
jgi:NAD(P)-dependent dehydrogenase (short-subunit alcohol dehydrogenase family)